MFDRTIQTERDNIFDPTIQRERDNMFDPTIQPKNYHLDFRTSPSNGLHTSNGLRWVVRTGSYGWLQHFGTDFLMSASNGLGWVVCTFLFEQLGNPAAWQPFMNGRMHRARLMNQLSLRHSCKGHNSAWNKFLSLNESLGFETETRYSRRSNFFCNMLLAIKKLYNGHCTQMS